MPTSADKPTEPIVETVVAAKVERAIVGLRDEGVQENLNSVICQSQLVPGCSNQSCTFLPNSVFSVVMAVACNPS